MISSSIKRIAVFCGSNTGSRPEYALAARQMAAALVARSIGLVYGGGGVGLMGELARTVEGLGGEVIGVIPETLVAQEGYQGLEDLRVVGSMHERKALMADLADGFIALPGGLGTMDEFFEILTWAQMGLHQKPCGLLNIGSYYDALLGFLDHAVGERFIKGKHRSLIIVDQDPEHLLGSFASYHPVSTMHTGMTRGAR